MSTHHSNSIPVTENTEKYSKLHCLLPVEYQVRYGESLNTQDHLTTAYQSKRLMHPIRSLSERVFHTCLLIMMLKAGQLCQLSPKVTKLAKYTNAKCSPKICSWSIFNLNLFYTFFDKNLIM